MITETDHIQLAFSQEDLLILQQAFTHLEHPSLAARLSNVIGTPIEIALNLLPRDWQRTLHNIAHGSISKALDAAIQSIDKRVDTNPRNAMHRVFCGFSGGVGGLFGLPALAIEMPVTTSLMLRSIAEIARAQGEDLNDPGTRLACMEVFALGARSEADNAAETGYYGVRLALSLAVRNAQQYLLEQGFKGETAPVLVKLVDLVAARFGMVISEKAAAQIMPVVGAAGGATLNVIFMKHFQDVAWSHFALRRLERKYGAPLVKVQYQQLLEQEQTDSDYSARLV